MPAAARGRWPGADFRIAGAYAPSQPDASADAYRADEVFHELAESERVLTGARRVLAPEGRIVPAGRDRDTIVIGSDDPALTRTVVHARADLTANPRAARRYRDLLLDAGFDDVTVEVHTAVFAGPAMSPLLTGLVAGASSAGTVTRRQADGRPAHRAAGTGRGRPALSAPPMFTAAATTARWARPIRATIGTGAVHPRPRAHGGRSSTRRCPGAGTSPVESRPVRGPASSSA
ncbi:methyltransferase domain-containing protein [Streptomyces sp. NPDC050388]|uniref:methyltransferase domain-containing protein n=1 Tax=Streptomyces sp. NPDC050388 TaxID=3155781 RepID=UPI00344478DE